jgi:hypothetical protein
MALEDNTLANAYLQDLVGSPVTIRTIVKPSGYVGILRSFDDSGVTVDVDSGGHVFVFRQALVSIEPKVSSMQRY